MTIKLTDDQLNSILDRMTTKQFVDYLSKNVERSVDWICDFIKEHVDNEQLQNKIANSFPPVQMKLFSE